MSHFQPSQVFGSTHPTPKALAAPQRYIQGENVFSHIGEYLSLVGARHVAVLISQSGSRRSANLFDSLTSNNIAHELCFFGGECSLEEIDLHMEHLSGVAGVDCMLAVGGGKCVDAGKSIAHRLHIPVVVCPTLASNDAPCSALSVLYTPLGQTQGVEFFPLNPVMVVVDTTPIIQAPIRYLVAGMGDAMATFYEADTCARNAQARNMIGTRPTITALAIGSLCAQTLYQHGVAAVEDVIAGRNSESVEQIVEANVLLSGLGFESGGLAMAHAVAQGFTFVDCVRDNYMHGEMVAIGLLTHLAFEQNQEQLRKASEFFARVGLPNNLHQIGLDPSQPDHMACIELAAASALGLSFIRNQPGDIQQTDIVSAMLEAHRVGLEIIEDVTDAAYRLIHS